MGIAGNLPGVGPVAVKDRFPLREQCQRLRFFISEYTTVGDLAYNSISYKASGFNCARLIYLASQSILVPRRATVAENIFHHIAYEAFVLLELSGKTDEL